MKPISRSPVPRSQSRPRPSKRTLTRLSEIAFSPLCSLLLCVSTSQIVPPESIASANPLITQNPPLELPAQFPNGLRQGTQISVNGRLLGGVWTEWQNGETRSLGISDASLVQILGLELLSTDNAALQPVEWFSPQAETLPTRLGGAYRYLDVTQWAQQAGLQVSVSGNVLQINSLPAQLSAIRQGRQRYGDRLVLELDRATPWQAVQQGSELLVTLNAQAAPNLIKSFRASPGNRLRSVQFETAANQLTLKVGLATGLGNFLRDDGVVRARVWTLANPNRLIIDLRSDTLEPKNILWAPGLRWQQRYITVNNRNFPVVWLEVDPRQAGITLRPISANSQAQEGTAPLLQIAANHQASAAINGGFFNRNNRLPLGAVRRDQRWLSGPILNRGAIAWTDQGEVKIGRLSLTETLTTPTGVRYPILAVNSGYVQAGLSRYTPEWGNRYIPLTNNESVFTVRGGAISNQQQTGVAGSSPIPIPPDGYLLVLRAQKPPSNPLTVGATVTIDSSANPPEFNRYPQILAGGPLLLQNQQIVLNAASEGFSPAFIQQKASRSAIGVSNRGTLIIAAVHNQPDSTGPSLLEIAQILQQLGATDAVNLDGGSSTSLYLGGQLLDRPPRSAARVQNGIGVFVQSQP